MIDKFAWLNAALFAIQLALNRFLGSHIKSASQRHKTLITPSPYAFSIWGFIYSMMTLTVVMDCVFPGLSFYSTSTYPRILRSLFAITCVANSLWLIVFTNDYVHSATFLIIVLWSCLLYLYGHIMLQWKRGSFTWNRYIGSELSIVLYFAWTSAALLISIAMSLQEIKGAFLSLELYIVLLSIFIFAGTYTYSQLHNTAYTLVVLWALAALAVRSDIDGLDGTKGYGIRACAKQGIVLICLAFAFSWVQRSLSWMSWIPLLMCVAVLVRYQLF
uniref:Uncharacterized protein AlNc14C127G6840 n=1 Tax=Albugo laibachii Nc14 TaxID=890382 RepID=F0WJX4_9STRA|nr:conserved hypothetical protein [Albugo laibachii Nc14]CCA24262.1 conserved hypothetical protein [Albugo laibachii Nc14]|eukprot:CCA24262.1 conserved hypothetical protein [Albugo laibachii Nc14]